MRVEATSVSPTPDLTPDQSQLLEHVAEQVTAGATRWYVGSRPGFGQTTWLEHLSAALPDRALLVAPPPGSEDTALSALTQVVDGLHRITAVTGLHACVTDPLVPFTEKLAVVARAVEAAEDQVVLLIDDPARWATNASEPAAARSEELLHELLRVARCQVVVGGGVPTVAPNAYAKAELPPARFPPEHMLEEPWGDLAPYAVEVAAWLREGFEVAPVTFRGLVASWALAARGIGAPAHTTRRLDLMRWLWEQTRQPSAAGLQRAWRRLAVVRQPVPHRVAIALVDGSDVDDMASAIVWRCLLSREENSRIRMPQIFRSTATDLVAGSNEPVQLAHATMAGFYGELLESASSVLLTPRHERVVHLGLATHIDALLAEQPMFREQLHAVGWWLSWRLERYGDAAAVFRRAVELDHSDSYAQHYLAYNLDRLGTNPDEVERSYGAAVDLRPESYWYWSRLVRFLITRQRIDDARAVWNKALSFFSDTEQPPAEDFYAELHGDVARSLLHALELDFAEQVLADVPEWARTQTLATLIERLRRLRIARDLGERVYVPLWALSESWATEGPFVLPKTLSDAPPREWWAARVDAIEADDALLSVAAVEPGEPPVVSELATRVPVADLADASKQPNLIRRGAMLEVAWYSTPSGDEVRAVRFHPPYEPDGQRLPPLFPDSLRYVRRR